MSNPVMHRYHCRVTLSDTTHRATMLAAHPDDAAERFARRVGCPVACVIVRYDSSVVRRARNVLETELEPLSRALKRNQQQET